MHRSVGLVFHYFNLFPHMSTLENVMLAPRQVLAMSKEAAMEREMDLLPMVGLRDHMAQTPPSSSVKLPDSRLAVLVINRRAA